jgi:uncharacterized membrane protein
MNVQPTSPRARKATRGFLIHLTVYVLVNALLVGINLATTPARLWFVWPLVGWGVGVLAHAAAVFAVSRRRAGVR